MIQVYEKLYRIALRSRCARQASRQGMSLAVAGRSLRAEAIEHMVCTYAYTYIYAYMCIMAVSINVGPVCGCGYNKTYYLGSIWGP